MGKESSLTASEINREMAKIRRDKIGSQFSQNSGKRQRTVTKGKV